MAPSSPATPRTRPTIPREVWTAGDSDPVSGRRFRHRRLLKPVCDERQGWLAAGRRGAAGEVDAGFGAGADGARGGSASGARDVHRARSVAGSGGAAESRCSVPSAIAQRLPSRRSWTVTTRRRPAASVDTRREGQDLAGQPHRGVAPPVADRRSRTAPPGVARRPAVARPAADRPVPPRSVRCAAARRRPAPCWPRLASPRQPGAARPAGGPARCPAGARRGPWPVGCAPRSRRCRPPPARVSAGSGRGVRQAARPGSAAGAGHARRCRADRSRGRPAGPSRRPSESALRSSRPHPPARGRPRR